MSKYRKGDIVELEFWDHADGEEPLLFKMWGRYVRGDRLSITLAKWTYSDQKEADRCTDDNVEATTILKSTIVSQRKLGRG